MHVDSSRLVLLYSNNTHTGEQPAHPNHTGFELDISCEEKVRTTGYVTRDYCNIWRLPQTSAILNRPKPAYGNPDSSIGALMTCAYISVAHHQ
eukprot:7514021-Pyramimonas_sp.AAC.1